MTKKSFQQQNIPRIPSEKNGVQVNFCRTPTCENFGVLMRDDEASVFQHKKDNDAKPVKRSQKLYALSGTDKDVVAIKCKTCQKLKAVEPRRQVYHQLKSNEAAYEEFQRISHYLVDLSKICPNEQCPSNTDYSLISIKKRGKTKSGSQRFFCNCCSTSWTSERKSREHTRPEINKILFKLLISRVPLRRICFILDLSMQTLYRRIRFIHSQCTRFIGDREKKLENKRFNRMYLCTDRQIQISNWTDRKTKKNSEFYGTGTADLSSGYVLAFNFNYDPSMDPSETEAHAMMIGDSKLKKHQRRYARVWLQHEFEQTNQSNTDIEVLKDWQVDSDEELQDALDALDDSSENYTLDDQIPHKGLAVHNEYSLIAHFLLVKKLLANTGKTRFFMDQDTGMKTWYSAVFSEEIKSNTSDGFLVRMSKELTVDEKQRLAREDKKAIAKWAGKPYAAMTPIEVDHTILSMMKPNVINATTAVKDDDAWVSIPTPSMAEPNKKILAITDIYGLDIDHQSNLYRKGGLHAIDRFFLQLRRKISIFERPYQSGSNAKRVWYGYTPYNPELYQLLGDIFRVFYNYCQESGKDNKTPAVRLGLARGTVAIEQIIYLGRYNNKDH